RLRRAIDGSDRPATRQQRKRLGAISTTEIHGNRGLIAGLPGRQEFDRIQKQGSERATLDRPVVLLPGDPRSATEAGVGHDEDDRKAAAARVTFPNTRPRSVSLAGTR